jgi:hypothetical protein
MAFNRNKQNFFVSYRQIFGQFCRICRGTILVSDRYSFMSLVHLATLLCLTISRHLWFVNILYIVSRFTMLDTPVPIRTLKLSNIGPGYYLDGRPSREFQVLLVPFPLPPPPCRQSTVFSYSLCLNQVFESRWNKKKPSSIWEFCFRFQLGWFSLINNLIIIYNNITN